MEALSRKRILLRMTRQLGIGGVGGEGSSQPLQHDQSANAVNYQLTDWFAVNYLGMRLGQNHQLRFWLSGPRAGLNVVKKQRWAWGSGAESDSWPMVPNTLSKESAPWITPLQPRKTRS